MFSTLSQPALDTINTYLHLPIGDKFVSCPYYNNKRRAVRGALRVLIGKGNPDDIVEEATILSLREKIPLGLLSGEQLKEFLVNRGLGVDCSAFAYYVLDAELRATKKKSLGSVLKFSPTIHPLRVFLRQLRKVENTDVSTLANDKNSHVVELNNVNAGDMITIIDSGLDASRNHVMIIHQVEKNMDGIPALIRYSHSLQWQTDGKYDHGVRQGQIIVTDINQPLTEQRWVEQDKEGVENETYSRAASARIVEIRRLNAFG